MSSFNVRFYRTDDLAAQLAVLAHTDPARLVLTNKIASTDLLVLDDFLTTSISGDTANALFNILAAREHTGSTMITSQFTPEHWYESIPDKDVAESLVNRLIGNAEIINLNGPNMRKT